MLFSRQQTTGKFSIKHFSRLQMFHMAVISCQIYMGMGINYYRTYYIIEIENILLYSNTVVPCIDYIFNFYNII